MKLNEHLTVAVAADFLNAKYAGSPERVIAGINEIHKVEAGDLTFVDIEKYYTKALTSKATIILTDSLIVLKNSDFNK